MNSDIHSVESQSVFLAELSGPELQWLASGFGLANIPLLDGPRTELQLEQILMRGRKSLEHRGLLKAHGASWEVEAQLGFLIHWMTNSTEKWQYSETRKTGQYSSCSLFLLEGRILLVFFSDTNYQFVAFPSLESGIQQWCKKVGSTFSNSISTQPEWNILEPNVVIRSSWKDTSLARQMADSHFLAWAADVISIGSWSEEKGDTMHLRISLVQHLDGLWAGHYVSNRPGECILKAVTPATLISLVLKRIASESNGLW